MQRFIDAINALYIANLLQCTFFQRYIKVCFCAVSATSDDGQLLQSTSTRNDFWVGLQKIIVVYKHAKIDAIYIGHSPKIGRLKKATNYKQTMEHEKSFFFWGNKKSGSFDMLLPLKIWQCRRVKICIEHSCAYWALF